MKLAKPTNLKWLLLTTCLLVSVSLACNMPIGGTATDPAPAPLASTPAEHNEQSTVSAPTPGTEPSTVSPTVLPTSTPLASATTSTPAGTEQATLSPTPTGTALAESGPLSFTYTISWRLMPEDPAQSIATVTIEATGGGGEYQYYRDELQVEGPVFEYIWASCRPNPGSLRVDSADEQSARTDYFERTPCPTPTKTPSS